MHLDFSIITVVVVIVCTYYARVSYVVYCIALKITLEAPYTECPCIPI